MMNAPQNQPCEMLSAWLKIATNRLCASAKSRIALEIEAHFNEAAEAHSTDGGLLAVAQAQALKELGDAEKAGRRFRRKHLTEKEEERLTEAVTKARKWPSKFRIILECLGFCAFAGIMLWFLRDEYFHRLLFLYSILIFLLPIDIWFPRVLMRGVPTSRYVSWFAINRAVSEQASGIIVPIMFLMQPSIDIASRLIFFGSLFFFNNLVSGFKSYPWFRIWLKVRNDKSGWNFAHSGSNPTSAT